MWTRTWSRARDFYRLEGPTGVLSGACTAARRRLQRLPARDLIVHMDITTGCNLKCRMCFPHPVGPSAEEMPEALLNRVAQQVFPLADWVFLSCAAEPLMAPHLVRAALERARLHRVPNTGMVTNGTLLTEDRARELVEYQVRQLNVSVDAARPETYQYIRGGPGLERVLDNIRRLQRIKAEAGSRYPEITMCFVLMRSNVEEAAEFVDLAAEVGASALAFNHLTILSPEMREECLFFHQKLANQCFARIRERLAHHGLPAEMVADFDLGAKPREITHNEGWRGCRQPWVKAFIAWYGQVFPCPVLRGEQFESLQKRNFQAIYYGPVFEQLRRALREGHPWPECERCSVNVDKHANVNVLAAYYPEGKVA